MASPLDNNNRAWSLIPETPQYLEKLELLCHTRKELKADGYIMAPLDAGPNSGKISVREVWCFLKDHTKGPGGKAQRGKGRGRGGRGASRGKTDSQFSLERPPAQNKKEHQKSKPSRDLLTDLDEPTEALNKAFPTVSDLRKPLVDEGKSKVLRKVKAEPSKEPKKPEEPKPVCTFHPDGVAYRRFTCCDKTSGAPGCTNSPEHVFLRTNDPYLQAYWQYHPTQPLSQSTKPTAKSSCRAIALDCEMGTALNMDTELIRLTAVDLFTGARLIDSLIYPSVKMKHYNTRYSGVSARDMNQAARSGQCIFGRDEARRQLLQFVGPETIVVVHGGNSDFSALRWIHGKVIDTFRLDSYFWGMREGGRSLKNLCQQILEVKVQQGRKGHDSLEDALACRELAHTWVCAIPD